MRRHPQKPVTLLLLLAALLQTIPSSAAPPTLEEAQAAATRALGAMAGFRQNGGWGRAISLDRTVLRGEHDLIAPGWVTLQPPATPTVAGVYLRAGQVLESDGWTNVASLARDAILAMQTADGGFPHEGDPTKDPKPSGTFDDDTTTACINFLLDWAQQMEKPAAIEPVERGAQFIIAAQYETCGGWPQYFPPPRRGYQHYITLNDNVTRNVIFTLLRLHREPVIAGTLEAAIRGGDCLIQLQGGEDEAIWAQQYDPETLEPAWARNFEPPGYTPAESLGAMEALIELYLETGEERFLQPLPAAFAWYDNHKLDNGKYARLYEPGTQRPVYGRRDKAEKVYDIEKATGGYGWQGDWYPHEAKRVYELIQSEGRDAVFAERAARAEAKPDIKALGAAAARAIKSIRGHGLWLSKPTEEEIGWMKAAGIEGKPWMVRSGIFSKNTTTLLDYIEALQDAPEESP